MSSSAASRNDVIAEGWVLKKRRKRMQGFARRYFTLHQSGILSYSFGPGQPIRDQIDLKHAAISTAPGRKDIHIDSSNATFHIKCLSSDDFNTWMAAFRTFVVPDHATVGRRSSVGKSMSRAGYHNRTGALMEEIGKTITELRHAFDALSEEDAKKKQGSSSKVKAEKDKGRESAKEHGGALSGLFKNRKSSQNHLFTNEAAAEDRHSSVMHASTKSPYQRLQTAIEELKYQYTALSVLLPPVTQSETSLSAMRGPPLATTTEEEDAHTPVSASSTLGRSSKRMSESSRSSGSVWFDAPEIEGAEEFVMDVTPMEEGQESKISTADSQSIGAADEGSIADTDFDSDSEEEQKPESATPTSSQQQTIARRTRLPSPVVGDEGSLFAVLKNNVGKDLSQVTLPVTFNEPLTLLQRTAEELQYYDLLSQAAQTTETVTRLCFVAAFAVSTYASSRYRSGRKAFNPMLAETFEDVRMKYISEKVCHNPVVLAFHAEGEGWELYATSSGKTKFWGKSLEIIPQGTTHLKIGEDHFEWNRPSSFIRNLMMGTKYLEHCGKMVITNTTTGSRCVLDFKESGYWGPSNVVSGTVFSSSGQAETTLEGKWDEQMVQKLDSSHLRVLWRISPFPKNALEYYGFTSFGMTLNEITPDLEGKLPPTDSRFRPDVRALEEGELDVAEAEKSRVESLQRERRKKGAERAPRWFKQVGEDWVYTGGYWEHRERGWDDVEPLW